MPRAAHDGGEDGPGSIVARETGFAHAGAVVDDERSDIIIHGELSGHKRGLWSPRSRQEQPLPPCPLPASRGLEPPGGARPSSGDKGSAGQPHYYHKRQTLARRRTHGRKPDLRPLPKRAQAPPTLSRRAASARAGGDHTQQEARAGAPAAVTPPLPDNGPALVQPRAAALLVSVRTRSSNSEEGERKSTLPSAHAPQCPVIERARAMASQPPPGRAGPAAPASPASRMGKPVRTKTHRPSRRVCSVWFPILHPLKVDGYGLTPASRTGPPKCPHGDPSVSPSPAPRAGAGPRVSIPREYGYKESTP